MSNNKPLILRIDEARQTIVAAVNAALKEQSLPCFLIEPILAEAHASISDGAARERENALKQVAENADKAGGEDDESGV